MLIRLNRVLEAPWSPFSPPTPSTIRTGTHPPDGRSSATDAPGAGQDFAPSRKEPLLERDFVITLRSRRSRSPPLGSLRVPSRPLRGHPRCGFAKPAIRTNDRNNSETINDEPERNGPHLFRPVDRRPRVDTRQPAQVQAQEALAPSRPPGPASRDTRAPARPPSLRTKIGTRSCWTRRQWPPQVATKADRKQRRRAPDNVRPIQLLPTHHNPPSLPDGGNLRPRHRLSAWLYSQARGRNMTAPCTSESSRSRRPPSTPKCNGFQESHPVC